MSTADWLFLILSMSFVAWLVLAGWLFWKPVQ